jgi:hypothetical protein
MTQDTKTGPKTEKEWADYYQAHKDDPDLWGDPVPPPKRPRGRPSLGRGARISVRFTPEEMAGIRAKSKAEGITYSEVVRRAVAAQSSKPD